MTQHSRQDGETMTATVLLLPLFVTLLLASGDLWSLTQALTRTQSAAHAGALYASAQAHADSALAGTRSPGSAARALSARDVEAAARANVARLDGGSDGDDLGVEVRVQELPARSYDIVTYPDGGEAASRRRTVRSFAVEVRASQRVRIWSVPLSLLLGSEATVTRNARIELPREVVA